jgi:hypothetical protein
MLLEDSVLGNTNKEIQELRKENQELRKEIADSQYTLPPRCVDILRLSSVNILSANGEKSVGMAFFVSERKLISVDHVFRSHYSREKKKLCTGTVAPGTKFQAQIHRGAEIETVQFTLKKSQVKE